MNEADQRETAAPAVGTPLDCGVGRLVPKRAIEYRMRYLRDGYILADAFRPHPGWGCKGYTVDAARLGEHTDDDLIRVAQETAPPGFWLHHIEAIGGEPHVRQVFKKGVPLSSRETPNVRGKRETP